MDNLRVYKKNIKNWNKTLESYVNWVAQSDLRNYFSKELKINDLSLWWATSICSKQNMYDNKWYYDLKKTLTERKKIQYNKLNFYILFFIKLIKNFIIHTVWFLSIKFLSFSRYKKIKRENCFHSINLNLFEKDNYLSDRCYGNLPFTNYANKNFHIISIAKKSYFFSSFFKKKIFKKQTPYVISDEFLSIFDVFYIYFKTLIYFFKLKIFISKNRKIFNIQETDCRNILEPFLLMSFAGEIQTQLFHGMGINNFIKKNKIKLFVTYAEFNPGYRSLYFFIRNMENPPTIISVQHGHCNKNLMYNFHKKSEFTKNKSLEGGLYSPAPDFYLTQGKQYDKILKNYFPNKTKIIGSLKYDAFNFKKNKNNKKINRIKFQNNKKIILICPSIGDELDILNYLKSSVDFNSRFILCPHPGHYSISSKKKIIKEFLSELEKKCHIEIYRDIPTINLLPISNLVICGFSTVAYESLFFGVQSVRIINSNNPHFFDVRDNLPVAKNSIDLKKILKKKILFKNKKISYRKFKKKLFL